MGQAGLGEWGKTLARNFADLADLAWLCDFDEELRSYDGLQISHVFEPAGEPLANVEKTNGQPFTLMGFSGEAGGSAKMS